MSRGRAHAPMLLRHLLRGAMARVVLLVLMVPMLIIGPFGGTSFVLHDHKELGVHTHIALTQFVMQDPTVWHEHDAGHEPAHSHSEAEHDSVDRALATGNGPHVVETTDGLLLSVPEQEHQLTSRTEVSPMFGAVQVVQCVLAWVWAQPDTSEDVGSPGGRWHRGPLHLCTLTASQRLVRTSSALLI